VTEKSKRTKWKKAIRKIIGGRADHGKWAVGAVSLSDPLGRIPVPGNNLWKVKKPKEPEGLF
jgi:hypothetical protein